MEWLWLIAAMAAVAILYSSVGHGGASGYLAVMALAGLAPEVIKPTALSLNLVVSTLGTLAFFRAGHFRWALFYPFALFSVPAAWLGGHWSLNPAVFKALIAVVLAYAAVRLLVPVRAKSATQNPPLVAAALAGTGIGLISGLIGVGGGIFLTPLLLLLGWASPRQAAAVSAPFIFVNSAAGLIGHGMGGGSFPSLWMSLAPAVLIGGMVGAAWGSHLARPLHIQRALALVLVVATVKLAIA